MNTSMYALTRSGRACLLFAVAFLASATLYGLFACRVLRVMRGDVIVTVLQDCPVLVLVSLSVGFISTGMGHYAIRQCFRGEAFREEKR